MKKLFQISFVFLYVFLLNGNGFLYAHTNKENKAISLEKVFSSSNITSELVISEFDNQFSIPTLQEDSFPSGKKKSKRFKFPFFEKEEKEKEDKFTSFEYSSKISFAFASFLVIPLFDRFYHYNKNYLHVSESLNYFLFHKCYILFQVFRL